MSFPVIPDILKNQNWQKEKGKLAKVFAGKTGIGDQMNKLKAEWEKLDRTKLEPATTYRTIEEADDAIKICKTEFAKAEPVRKAAYDLRELANRIAEQFQKNKLIPGSTVTHVKNIATAADHFGVAVKSYNPTAEFEAAKQRTAENIKRIDEFAKKAVIAAYPKCLSELNKVKSGKPPVWTSDAWNAFRAYAAAVVKWGKLAQLRPQWTTLSSLGPDRVHDVLKHVEALGKLLAATQALVG